MVGSSVEGTDVDVVVDETSDEGTATGYGSVSTGGRGNTTDRFDQFKEKMVFGDDNQNAASDTLTIPPNPYQNSDR